MSGNLDVANMVSIKVLRSDGNVSSHDTLVIVLSAVFGFIGVALLVIGGIWCVRSRRRKLFNRGITPIGDEEIASWKVPQDGDEKEMEVDRYTTRPSHTSKGSTSSTRRATTIQYSGRPSADVAASSRSFVSHKYSMEFPLSPPEAAVVARAPNARSGLTDDSIPGDDPFVAVPRRQPSRLQKVPPTSITPKDRSRSNSMKSHTGGAWPATRDTEYGTGHSRMYSTSSMPPVPVRGDNDVYTNLSPPPSYKGDVIIGQAIG